VKAWTVSLNELGGILEDLRQGHAPVRGTRQTEDLIKALEQVSHIHGPITRSMS
jgi:hypothetical protein